VIKEPTDKKVTKDWADSLLELNRLHHFVYTAASLSEIRQITESDAAANELEAKAFEAIKVNQNPTEYRRLMKEAATVRNKAQAIREKYLPAMRDALERGKRVKPWWEIAIEENSNV
jgi:hypothetical protein